ncbi:import inner membrane translocase subunit tim44 [Auricularia subglabra TFB-10046 SS5]|nr:import inner membrane translocase subunit tim44 [Auricularia subglabra TFB-10046 SS5]
MLPRHLLARAARARASSARPAQLQARPAAHIPLCAGAARNFHASAARRDEMPKSPYRAFVDTLREEIRKDRELLDSVKTLQGDVEKIQDSEAMRRAKEMYERARLTSSIKENPKLRAAAEELRKRGLKVSDAVGEAVKAMEESDIMRTISKASSAVATGIEKTTEPIRKTEAYKAIAETIIDALDDSGSAKHAGYEEKEARRARRQQRLLKLGKEQGFAVARARVPKVDENPEAGSALVLHESSVKNAKWEQVKQSNPLLRKIAAWRQAYDESENELVATVRGITSTIGSWFDENETAQVTRMFRDIDPSFTMEGFGRELREYIVPEIVDAYLSADREALKLWCSEATHNVLWATLEVYLKQGLISDSKVLDIRNVDIVSGKILDNELPVLIVQFATQEVLLFRKAKTGEIAVGAEGKVEQCMYAAVFTRSTEEADLANELTGGWKVVEMARRSARNYL